MGIREGSRRADKLRAPDNTGENRITRFRPGQSGNPAGRPKGSRIGETRTSWRSCANVAPFLVVQLENYRNREAMARIRGRLLRR